HLPASSTSLPTSQSFSLSLHDARPIWSPHRSPPDKRPGGWRSRSLCPPRPPESPSPPAEPGTSHRPRAGRTLPGRPRRTRSVPPSSKGSVTAPPRGPWRPRHGSTRRTTTGRRKTTPPEPRSWRHPRARGHADLAGWEPKPSWPRRALPTSAAPRYQDPTPEPSAGPTLAPEAAVCADPAPAAHRSRPPTDLVPVSVARAG